MEGVAPPLQALLTIKSHLQCGFSVKSALLQQTKLPHNSFSAALQGLLLLSEQGGAVSMILSQEPSIYRRQLLFLLHRGLSGQSILKELEDLALELENACELELNDHVNKLPIKLMVPLFLFHLPALFLLLLGPIIVELLQTLS